MMIKQIVVREQDDGSFVADRPYLSGMPIVGRGKTWKEALGDLLYQATFEGGPHDNPPKIMNRIGEIWRDKYKT